MDTKHKHDIWELVVRGSNEPIIASVLIEQFGMGDQTIAQSKLKYRIAKEYAAGESYVRCGLCGCPLQYVAKSGHSNAHFRHNTWHSDDSYQAAQNCNFYSSAANPSFIQSIYAGEGAWHLETKHFLKDILTISTNVKSESVVIEPYLYSDSPELNTYRKPDIYFQDNKGNKFAIELTRWWLSAQVAVEREAFFRKEEINLIWLFSPECEKRANSTYFLIMFGSNLSSPSSLADIDSSTFRGNCNAFVLSNAAKQKCILSQCLYVDVHYAHFEFIKSQSKIDVFYGKEMHPLTSMKLSPSERLPFIVSTCESYNQALTDRTQHLNELEQTRRASVRTALARRIKSIRHELFHQRRRLENLDVSFPFLPSDTDLNLSHFNGYQNRDQIALYIDEIKSITSSISLEHERLKERRQRASSLRLIRSESKRAFERIKTASSEAEFSSCRSTNTWLFNLIKQNSHPHFSELKQKLDHALNHQIRAKSNSELTDQKVQQECNEFISGLDNGSLITTIPTTNSFSRVKASRLKSYCDRNQAVGLGQQILASLEQAEDRFKTSFLNKHYMLIMEDFNHECNYSEVLDKVAKVLGSSFKGRKQRDFEGAMLQSWLREALKLFVESTLLAMRAIQLEMSKLSSNGLKFYRQNRYQIPLQTIDTVQTLLSNDLIVISADDTRCLLSLSELIQVKRV